MTSARSIVISFTSEYPDQQQDDKEQEDNTAANNHYLNHLHKMIAIPINSNVLKSMHIGHVLSSRSMIGVNELARTRPLVGATMKYALPSSACTQPTAITLLPALMVGPTGLAS